MWGVRDRVRIEGDSYCVRGDRELGYVSVGER